MIIPAQEVRLTRGPAMQGLVLTKVEGMSGQAGLIVLLAVGLGSSKDQGTAVRVNELFARVH